MLGHIERYLRQNWEDYGLGHRPPPGRLRLAVISTGSSVHNKLVCPCWKGDDPLPCLIVKLPRHPHYNYRLEREYRALERTQHYVPLGPPRAPRPLTTTELAGFRVTAETATAGRTLLSYVREYPRRAPQTLERLKPGADWLARLHTRSAGPATPLDLEELLFTPLAAALDELDLSKAEQEGLSHIHNVALRLAATQPLPVVFSHHDLSPGNVMVDAEGGFAGVVDWESAGYGLPTIDLLYFLARCAYETRAVGAADQLRGFRELFFLPAQSAPGALAPTLAARWLDDYCRQVGVARDWLPVLFAVGTIMHARKERPWRALQAEDALRQVLPKTVRLDATRPLQREPTHFRAQLHYFLLHLDSFVGATPPERMLAGAPWPRQEAG